MEKEEIFEVVVKHIRTVIPSLEDHAIQPEDKLKELGADSLDRTEILDMAMGSISLDVPRVEVYGAKDIGELVDVLHRAAS